MRKIREESILCLTFSLLTGILVTGLLMSVAHGNMGKLTWDSILLALGCGIVAFLGLFLSSVSEYWELNK